MYALLSNKRQKVGHRQLGHAGSLLHDTEPKNLIGCKTVFVFMNRIFWFVALCGSVTFSRRFEVTHRIYLQM
jgi:hypothetical protein